MKNKLLTYFIAKKVQKNLKYDIIDYVPLVAEGNSPSFWELLINKKFIIMSEKTKAVLVRLGKGFGAGAIGAMALVTIKQPAVWTEFIPLLNSLGLAAATGGLTGLLLALQKWGSWKDQESI